MSKEISLQEFVQMIQVNGNWEIVPTDNPNRVMFTNGTTIYIGQDEEYEPCLMQYDGPIVVKKTAKLPFTLYGSIPRETIEKLVNLDVELKDMEHLETLALVPETNIDAFLKLFYLVEFVK